MKVPVRIYKMSGGGQYDVPPEVDVVKWIKQAGEYVNQGDPICEFEIEKGVAEIMAPVSGCVIDIAYSAGEKWRREEIAEIVGDISYYNPPFCWIETDESVIAPVLPKPQSDYVPPVQDKPAPVIVTHSEPRKKRSRISAGPFESIEEARKVKPRMSMGALRLIQEEKVSPEELFDFFGGNVGMFTEYHIKKILEKRDAGVQSGHDVVVTTDTVPTKIVRAVPLARTIAREKKIDLTHVQGTGPEGLILASDVEKKVDVKEVHQEVRANQPVAMIQESEEPILLSMPRLWRTIAANMEAGILTPTADVRVHNHRFNIRRLTEFYRTNRQSYKFGLWFPLMVAYAHVLRKEQFILFNSYWHKEIDTTGRITPYIAARRYVHMGIAYDRGETPVIDWDNKTIQGERLRILTVHNIHHMSLAEAISEVTRLFDRALQKKFSLQDTSGYTAIFNNIGVLGLHSGSALLTIGIASELNMGSVDLESGEAVIQLVLDHRLIDGAMTTSFFRELYKELMQRVLPELEAMLLEKK